MLINRTYIQLSDIKDNPPFFNFFENRFSTIKQYLVFSPIYHI